MLRFTRPSLVLLTILAAGPILASGLRSGVARAQVTTTPTATSTVGPSITFPVAAPTRLINNVVQNPRPANQTPLGVNYSDCINDMVLQFSVALSGFLGTTNLQIWATKSTDCTAPTTRGIGANANTCWLVNQGLTLPNLQSAQTKQFNVRVQDLVGPQNAPALGAGMVNEGPSACTQQPNFAAVPMDIWFLALDGSGNSVGTPADYRIPTDLVGPPAPLNVTTQLGDTFLAVNWTANTDGDTGGYNVFIDPIRGQEGAPTGGGSTLQMVCPDSGSPTAPSPADATADTGAMTSADAAPDTGAAAVDAGCPFANVGGSGTPTASNAMCAIDPVLSGGIVIDSGVSTAVPAVDASDDSGVDEEAGAAVPTGGGISTIPKANLVNPNATTGTTSSGESNSTYNVTGLKNGVNYNVVVAAVDNSGNTGNPSDQTCGMPALVNDFYETYRGDGGKAGGGFFCALDAIGAPAGLTVAFAGAGALVVASLRRRRSKKR